jgi:hypothetical protein
MRRKESTFGTSSHKWSTCSPQHHSKRTTQPHMINCAVRANNNAINRLDVRFYWVRDRAVQNQFDIGWGPSAQNLGDYFTKHHTPAHHKGIRKMYIHDSTSPTYIPSAHAKPPHGYVDITIFSRAPSGQHANTATTDGRSTSTNWQCLAWTIFCAPNYSLFSSHKFS